MTWYVRSGEREIGPLGEDALRALVGTGQITPDTPLWREGLSGWTAALALPGVLGPRGAVPLAPPSASAAIVTPLELATPWRRYWARSVDVMLDTFLAAVLISAIRPSFIAHVNAVTGQGWIVLLILLPFALTVDTLIYWALGNTPGKAIAGIKALEEGGQRALRAAAYLGRNFGVYLFGLGLGVPLVSLITLILSYRRAAAAQSSTWDRFSGSRVYALSAAQLRTWLAAGIYLLGLATLFAFGLHSQHDKSRYAAARAPAPVLQEELTQAANRVNAGAPRMIDSITRLDGARAGPGSLFTYEYTLTNMRVGQLSGMTRAALRWRLSAHVRQAVCHSAALEPLLRTGTTARFEYHDRDGLELVMVSVSSADCGN